MKYISDEDCCFEQDNFWFRYRAAAIIIEDGCVLMAYNDVDDYFYSIGGGVHLGETSEQAVIREVKEETGMKYEEERLAFIRECMYHGKTAFSGKQCHIVEFYYLMKPKGKRLLKNGESRGTTQGVPEYLRWIPLQELADYKVFPQFFGDKLCEMPQSIQHDISDER